MVEMKNLKQITNEIKALQSEFKKQRYKINSTFGTKVKNRRKKMGLSALELAQLIGRDRTQVTNIELGNSGTTLSTIIQICDALETTPNDLMGY